LDLREKKISYGYTERREKDRQEYQQKIKEIDVSTLVYLDEAGINDNETYPYGWGLKGKRVYGMRASQRQNRISLISGLNRSTLQAPFVFEGYCDGRVFEAYIEKVLLPELEPGQTVIMDNASFHKSKKITDLIESKGCRLIYLPAYSPDFNPIEHYWHMIKTKMRKFLKTNKDLYEAAKFAFSLCD